MKKLMPTIFCVLGGLMLGFAVGPGITKSLMAIGGLLLVYRAGYSRAKMDNGSC